MNLWDLLILIGIALALGAAVWIYLRAKRKGTGCCSSGGCGSCDGCAKSKSCKTDCKKSTP